MAGGFHGWPAAPVPLYMLLSILAVHLEIVVMVVEEAKLLVTVLKAWA